MAKDDKKKEEKSADDYKAKLDIAQKEIIALKQGLEEAEKKASFAEKESKTFQAQNQALKKELQDWKRTAAKQEAKLDEHKKFNPPAEIPLSQAPDNPRGWPLFRLKILDKSKRGKTGHGGMRKRIGSYEFWQANTNWKKKYPYDPSKETIIPVDPETAKKLQQKEQFEEVKVIDG